MSALPPVERLQAVALRPGDVIVVTVPEDTDDADLHWVADAAKQWFPGHKIIVKSANVDMAAYRPGDPL